MPLAEGNISSRGQSVTACMRHKARLLKSDFYDHGVKSRGEGPGVPGSAFFSVFHCIAFLLTSTDFSADFLYSLGYMTPSEFRELKEKKAEQ